MGGQGTVITDKTVTYEVTPEADGSAPGHMSAASRETVCVGVGVRVGSDSSVLPVTHLNLKNDEHTHSPRVSEHVI